MTPRKWSAEAPEGPAVCYAHEWNTGPRFIFTNGRMHFVPLPESLAAPAELDALGRQMAAGPVLLRAAEAAVECGMNRVLCCECWNALKAAIALAKGEKAS